jgi:hypothetical protein
LDCCYYWILFIDVRNGLNQKEFSSLMIWQADTFQNSTDPRTKPPFVSHWQFLSNLGSLKSQNNTNVDLFNATQPDTGSIQLFGKRLSSKR